MPMLMSQFSPVRIVATYTQAQGSQQERSHCRPPSYLRGELVSIIASTISLLRVRMSLGLCSHLLIIFLMLVLMS